MGELKVTRVSKGTDRGMRVENPLPDAPENIHKSKAQFQADKKLSRDKELKIREFAKTLDEEKEEPKVETEVVNDKPKAKGRPRKIE